jgi:dihydrofolate reductase
MLVMQEFVSADGFAASVDGNFDFGGVIPDWSALDADQLELAGRTGTIVLGRRTYELFIEFWPTAEHTMAESINTIPKAVISQSLTGAAPWGEWPAARVEAGPLSEVIARLAQAAAPKDLLVWGSLGLTKSLLRERLVDELRLIVCPVVLGAGIGVIPEDLGRTALTLAAVKQYDNGAAELTYRLQRVQSGRE